MFIIIIIIVLYIDLDYFRRKGGVTGIGGEAEDPLGLDVAAESKFPKDQLTVSSPLRVCLVIYELKLSLLTLH